LREWDSRTHKLSNVVEVLKGTPETILLIEKLIKEKFLDIEFSKLNKTTEIFPNYKKELILEYIKELNN
jgi:hypothetical protein